MGGGRQPSCRQHRPPDGVLRTKGAPWPAAAQYGWQGYCQAGKAPANDPGFRRDCWKTAGAAAAWRNYSDSVAAATTGGHTIFRANQNKSKQC